ncbi:DUF2382 domain-containing protein, partial [Solicola sp. PLA-1-18]|uniref:DUF2382 domain-containing protein n=1 Tax=Solicola sp. PLA-1-18 TaxID=3380532 RepID=UPI003B793657
TDDARTLMNGGGNVVETDGTKIGKIGQIFLDDHTGEPEWVTVSTGMFGTAESFVPLSQASVSGNDLTVGFDKAMVKDAPRVDANGHLDPSEEQQLYTYYGLSGDSEAAAAMHPSGQSDTGRRNADDPNGTDTHDRRDRAGEPGIVGQDTSGPTTDDAMTRSEEQLRVGTENVETGKARLRKYVVTENVTQTVPVSHEEVRIEREPITDANRGYATSGGDITEEEHEVTLHAERPVVDKEVVAQERVKLDTRTVTDEAQIDETLRKEQIDTEGTSDDGIDVDGDGRLDTDRKG